MNDAVERVMIVNQGYEPVWLQGWRLTDEVARHSFTFPDVVIPADQALRVHMGVGTDDASDVYVGRRQRWWNNTGDCAYLYDRDGVLVHSHRYESLVEH